ncbi:MAG TPA: hypothetical protein PKJ85_11130 [Nitrosomonas nitrosa]|nr:hypothetical protein [Nitrosomonas nitrosa]
MYVICNRGTLIRTAEQAQLKFMLQENWESIQTISSLLSDICPGLLDIVAVHMLDCLTLHSGDHLQTLMIQSEQ